MPRWIQALLDLAFMAITMALGGLVLRILLAIFARHTNVAKFKKCVAIVIFIAATFAFFLGPEWHLPMLSAAGLAFIAAIAALYFVCAVTLKEAAGISLILMPLLCVVQLGMSMVTNMLMPNRWTFAQQYELANTIVDQAEDKRITAGMDGLSKVKLGFNIREQIALSFRSLAMINDPATMQQMNSGIGGQADELKEMGFWATNEQQRAEDRAAYQAMRQEIIDREREGMSNAVSENQMKAALAMLEAAKPREPGQPVPDLDQAVSNLWLNMASTNGTETLRFLGHSMADIQRQLVAMRSDTGMVTAASGGLGLLGSTLSGLATGGLAAAAEPGGTGTVNGAELAGLAATNARTSNAVPFVSSIKSHVAVAEGDQIVYAKPPEELRLTAVVSRPDGSGYVVHSGRIVPVGSDVSVETTGGVVRLKLETVVSNAPRWSLVPEDADETVIGFGNAE